MKNKFKYAGIGSRKTPNDVLQEMKEYAKRLASIAILQTGGALGADSAFEEGAREASGEVTLFLPWRGYNNKEGLIIKASKQKEIEDFASQYHPAWDRCSPAVRKLHARNMLIINEADFVICWTPDGKDSGGTGQALRFAMDVGIPIYNLFNKEDKKKLEAYLQSIGV